MVNNSLLLWICQGLFLLRVIGQVIVVFYSPSWLPPQKEWYSGLIPYPILLTIQIVIIIFMTRISWDNTKKAGNFFVTKSKTKKVLLIVSLVYFLIMCFRYLFQIVLVPENRWFRGTIPIISHWVLAAYIFLLTKNKPTQS